MYKLNSSHNIVQVIYSLRDNVTLVFLLDRSISEIFYISSGIAILLDNRMKKMRHNNSRETLKDTENIFG